MVVTMLMVMLVVMAIVVVVVVIIVIVVVMAVGFFFVVSFGVGLVQFRNPAGAFVNFFKVKFVRS